MDDDRDADEPVGRVYPEREDVDAEEAGVAEERDAHPAHCRSRARAGVTSSPPPDPRRGLETPEKRASRVQRGYGSARPSVTAGGVGGAVPTVPADQRGPGLGGMHEP